MLFDPTPIRRMSLVALSSAIASSLSNFGVIAVEGEVSYQNRKSITWFQIKDNSCEINVQVPTKVSKSSHIVHGEKVLVTGRLVYNNSRGVFYLRAQEVSPVGEGAILASIEKARSRLKAEGLLDRARKPLPKLPRGVGVICGNEAAVKKDIESIATERFERYPIYFFEVTVSGPGAAGQIIQALNYLDSLETIEVVILARGGGSPNELLPFSDENLCRKICEMTKPVVSAIGHESDYPLCDEVVDIRCGTPSIAAQKVVPLKLELDLELKAFQNSIQVNIFSILEEAQSNLDFANPKTFLEAGLNNGQMELDQCFKTLSLFSIDNLLQRAQQRIDQIQLENSFRTFLHQKQLNLSSKEELLEALDPREILKRGYAIVRNSQGKILRQLNQVKRGDQLQIEVVDGTISVVVGP